MMKIRVSPEVELDGLDMHEFGALCYPDFVLATTKTGGHAPTSSPSVPGYPPSASAFTSEPGSGPGGTFGGQS